MGFSAMRDVLGSANKYSNSTGRGNTRASPTSIGVA